MVYCVGLTGGMACGKTTVARYFAELGAAVIDTDTISHALTQPGAQGFEEIVRQFGPGILLPDGRLDRAQLRAQVFSDTRIKSKLEAILHPLIHEQALAALHACRAPYAILVVPLLFETGHYLPLIRRRLVVDCTETEQIARGTARSGLSESEVRAIMANQLPRDARLKQADDIIHNTQDRDALRDQIAALHARYLAQARSDRS